MNQTVVQEFKFIKMIEFSFLRSQLCTGLPLRPDDSPLQHLLAPQPSMNRQNMRKQHRIFDSPNSNHNNLSFNTDHYGNITLGNSPSLPKGITEPVHISKSTLPHKKNTMEKNHQNAIEIEVQLKDSSRGSKSTKHFMNFRNAQNAKELQRESKKPVSEVKHSTGNIAFGRSDPKLQFTMRNPREQSLYISSAVNKKFTQKFQQKDMTNHPNIQAYIKQNQEQKQRIGELEQLNKSFSNQLYKSKQKFKGKELQLLAIKQKYDELLILYDQHKGHQFARISLEQENIELRSQHLFLKKEIEELKAAVCKHELKNGESLKLLQLLNQNVTKKEEKLNQELADLQNSHAQLSDSKASLELKLIKSEELAQRIQELSAELMTKDQELAQKSKEISTALMQKDEEIQLLKREIQKSKEEHQEIFSFNHQLQMQREKQNKKIQTEIQSLKLTIENLLLKLQQSSLLSKSIESEKEKIVNEMTMKNNEKEQNLKELLNALHAKDKEFNQYRSQNESKMNEMVNTFEAEKTSIFEELAEKSENAEKLQYSNNEREMKIEVLEESMNEQNIEIKDLKDEKKILYGEKEQLKEDIHLLMLKNDELFQKIQEAKLNQINLSSVIDHYQKELIQSEQKITQNLTTIADLQINISKLTKNIDQKDEIINLKQKDIDLRSKKLEESQTKLKKYEKILQLYKDEISRLQSGKDVQWTEMKDIYEGQIQILQKKIGDFAELEKVRSRKSQKTEQSTSEKHNSFHEIEIKDKEGIYSLETERIPERTSEVETSRQKWEGLEPSDFGEE